MFSSQRVFILLMFDMDTMFDDGQAGVYLEAFNNFLYERHQIVSSFLDKCGAHLERIVEIIGSYGIIPSDMVCIPPLSLLCRVVSLMISLGLR